MSANSPTYSCNATSVPVMDGGGTPYCTVPGGHQRMNLCCSQVGDGIVNFYPDCYSWCQIDVPGGDGTQDDAFRHAMDGFKSCLTNGENSTDGVPRMVCSPGKAGKNGGSSNFEESGSSGSVRVGLWVVLTAMLLHVGIIGGVL